MRTLDLRGMGSSDPTMWPGLWAEHLRREATPDAAETTFVSWRNTLVDVLGEPARDLDNPAEMAAHVIRTLRKDLAGVVAFHKPKSDACDAAHDALDEAGAPRCMLPADRIRALVASHAQADAPDPGLMSAAPVMLGLLDALDAMAWPGPPTQGDLAQKHILRALRSLLTPAKVPHAR